MSINTMEQPRADEASQSRHVADDEGSGNIVDWERWDREHGQDRAAREEWRAYAVRDVGRNAIFGRNRTRPGFAPDFQSDRIMPRQPMVARRLGSMIIPEFEAG